MAKSAGAELIIVEGEKKSAAACERGLFATGVAGVWNWRQQLDNGERLTIPLLDQFIWIGRAVELIPDSDAWREEKQLSVLSGFFALGHELLSRGATVRLVKLPEKGAAKVGFDDWLVSSGNDWETLWPALERMSLDDERLAGVTAWWQSWRERHALQEQFRSKESEALDMASTGGLYRVKFAAHQVTLQFDRLTDARGGISAELTVYLGNTELLGTTDIGLKTDSARDKISKTLKALASSIPWKRLLERACTTVLKAHRNGAPILTLEPTEHTSTHVPFVLNPLIYRNHQTLAFAPGGSCKSYLALYFALLACEGASEAGIAAIKVPVLYLDWELDEETVKGRLKKLQTGHPKLKAARPFYRRCEYPLHQEVHQIATQVAELGIRLLVVDSAALACGGDLASPDSAIKLQRALRTIGCASLVLAHVPKSIPDGQEASAYGSVFFRELARNVWEFQRTGTASSTDPVRVALHQKKNNFGPDMSPLGFELTFNDVNQTVRVEAFDPADEPVFEEKLPVPSRIRNLLEDGRPRTSKQIADELVIKLDTVKSALSRDKGRKWMMVGNDHRNPLWTVLSPK